MICAIVNDCGSHIDEIWILCTILNTFPRLLSMLSTSSNLSWPDSSYVKIALNHLVVMVMGDLRDQYTQIFTQDWLVRNFNSGVVKIAKQTSLRP